MKTLKYIAGCCLVSLLIAIMISCELDEYNPSGVTAESIWSNPQGFQTLVNAAYINQRTFYGKEDGVIMGEAGTDIWFRADKSFSYRQVFRYIDYTPDQASSTKNYWRDLWPAVNMCNAGINRIDDAGLPETERNAKLGELRYLRAFYYWHIVETWGGVALFTNETAQSPNLSPTRSPVEDFYDLMIDDLDYAIEWLPVTPENPEEYSRATRKSAMGFLARVLLTRAYYSLDNNNKAEADAYFTRARDVAHATLDSAARWGVSLYQNYADLWDNRTGGNNKNNYEALYVISNSTNPNMNYDINGNRLHLWFMNRYSNKPGLQIDLLYGNDSERRFMPTQYYLDLFDETKDSRYAASFQDVWLCNVEEGYEWDEGDLSKFGKDPSLLGSKINLNDTALYITKNVVPDKRTRNYVVIDRDSLFNADTIYTIADLYLPLKKFFDPNRDDPSAKPGFNDILVIRLAEMYLIAAEAEFQLGDNAGAAADINVIRTRAAWPGRESDMLISAGDVTLDFILDERAREFGGEHMRWFDLKRTRTLVDRIQRYNKNIQIPDRLMRKDNGIFENVLLRPIPQNEIDALLNGEEFGQNPGYLN
ncbi:MAG: RagB/SusD family nutrient uptake outer membrane protein [Bacteroidales bacterium]|nr:RagB/SusD family nutrient uptake outer membrane protein [Bacteroidales bacterium]MBN2764570.1 RagB/SusD family nutrient uptake outer membrane protein [Bacteroidales bacterium]